MRFLMVDNVIDLEPGRSILASKTMDPAEELFRDHFPGFPAVPGVLLTEMMAQAAGKCLFSESPERGYPMLVRVKDASFRSWVRPGQEVRIHAEVTKSTGSYAMVKCHASVEGKRVGNADLSFSFLPTKEMEAESGIPGIFSTEGHQNGD